MGRYSSAARTGYKILREQGVRRTAKEGAYFGWQQALGAYLRQTRPEGVNFFSEDWDVLLILDACRVDLMESVCNQYDFLSTVESRNSNATYSLGWLENTFPPLDEQMLETTGYVTANPFADDLPEAVVDTLGLYEPLHQYAWDNDQNTVWAEPVTDHAISAWRDNDLERLVVHYMQPHYPFRGEEWSRAQSIEEWGEFNFEDEVWTLLRDRKIKRGEVWEAYRRNLEYVLESVSLFLSAVNAETVAITADHGNALGERGIYGHPPGVPLRCVQEVPWVTTDAERTTDYEPEEHYTNDTLSRQEKLAHLGYTEMPNES